MTTDDRYLELLERLAARQRSIDELDAERVELIADLDELISTLRTAGCPWTLVNEACGTANIQVSFERRRRVSS